MSAMQRTKGASGEREFCGLIRDELGVRLVRALGQARDGGHDLDVDADCSGSVAAALRWWAIEVKRHAESPPGRIRAWWGQATSQAAVSGRVPALAYRSDRADWRVIVPLSALVPAMEYRSEVEWSVVLSLPAFCAVIREGGMGEELLANGRSEAA